MNGNYSSYSIEVNFLCLGTFQRSIHVFGENIVRCEILSGKLPDVSQQGRVLLLQRRLVSRVSDRNERFSSVALNIKFIRAEQGP